MKWLRLCFCQIAMICAALTGCAGMGSSEPPAPLYDVRSAVVLGGPGIAGPLLSGISDRVNAAINATVRTDVYPRVVLTIRIVSVTKGQGFDKNRNVAKITADAASVDDGSVIGVSAFDVSSFANDPAMADQILAEDIAARLRSAFKLTAGRG
ncbi:hypothetical protein AB4Z25_03885 [Rhizobium sp. RAF36]|uniref:hypothetical protein n=1 Tax=Rhizobium sp. RAF36 TaxID=3233055 RepID=UPI000DD890B6